MDLLGWCRNTIHGHMLPRHNHELRVIQGVGDQDGWISIVVANIGGGPTSAAIPFLAIIPTGGKYLVCEGPDSQTNGALYEIEEVQKLVMMEVTKATQKGLAEMMHRVAAQRGSRSHGRRWPPPQ
jgi:hypothetical protein